MNNRNKIAICLTSLYSSDNTAKNLKLNNLITREHFNEWGNKALFYATQYKEV